MGGVFALLISSEFFEPGLQIMRPEFFSQLIGLHGLVMIFGAIMPAFVGFANSLIPGADRRTTRHGVHADEQFFVLAPYRAMRWCWR